MATIIFDMDGTIADSFDYVSDFMAQQAGMSRLTPEKKQQLRGLSMINMARRLGFHWWHAPILFYKGQRRMHKVIHRLRSFEGIPELIRKLHAEGHELFVLSSNSRRNVNHFLHTQKIHRYFVEIYGGVGMFNKASALKQLFKEQNLDIRRAVYVGDELRDVQAAKSIGLKAIAVTWGFADPQELKAARPAGMANTPAELMQILEEL